MIKNNSVSFFLLLLSILPFGSQAQKKSAKVLLGKNSIKEVIAAMTLREKAALLVGNDNGFSRGYPSIFGGPDTLFGQVPAVVGNTKVLVAGSAGTTFPIPRLGIPAIVLADGPAGLRIDAKRSAIDKTYYATAFPIATLIASSWDNAVAESVGRAMGNEVLEYGVDILLAPALNIHRNPLGGRNFEYFSEDPIVSGKMASALVKGIQFNGVGTSIKHFAANNNENNRMNINVQVSQRALREIYLKGFKIAVEESNPWTVMSSYNKINGKFANETGDLLTTILRNEWKFKGFVMTDWFAGRDQIAQIKAGNDMIMPGSSYIVEEIVKAVKQGRLSEKDIENDLKHILQVITRTPRFKQYNFSNKPDLLGHAKVARQAASAGMVLLKNSTHTLPFSNSVLKVATFGNATYNTISGGTGSGDVNKAYNVSIAKGLQNAGYVIDKTLNKRYNDFLSNALDTLQKPKDFMERKPLISEYTPTVEEIKAAAMVNDIAVITLSRSSGEFHDRVLDNDFYLSTSEKQMINEVSSIFRNNNKKTVVLLNVGGVIETASWKNLPDAILLVWQPGQEGGNAVADILKGKVNPSGKLCTTFPIDYSHVPSSKNFPLVEDSPEDVKYQEGVFVGYRFYNTFKVATSYPFGFGLSYTKFDYKLKEKTISTNKKISLLINISNTGKSAGREAVQLYITAPGKHMDKPAIELKKFAKTIKLSPGSSQSMRFDLDMSDLASFDEAKSCWVAEKGDYDISIGASSVDVRIKFKVTIPNDVIVERVNPVLKPTTDFKAEEINVKK